MKPAQNKRAVIVGVFIVLGIIIFLAGVLMLGGQQNTFEKTIAIKAVFDNVQGLQAGNNVWYSGVKIGTVKKVDLYKNNLVEVVLNIEKRSQSFIHTDAKAKISSDGLIGNRIVVLMGGTPAAPVVESGAVLEADKALNTSEIATTLQDNNKNLVAITSNLKIISDRIAAGQGTVGKLLTDESLLQHLQATINTLQTASLNTKALTANLAQYTSRLQEKGTFTNDLLTDTVIFSRLRATVVQVQQITAAANEAVTNLKTATGHLNDKTGPAGVILQDTETADRLKATIKNLESGSAKLDENMEAMQHSFLLRGYFEKKAKYEEKQKKEMEKTGNLDKQ